MKKLVCLFMAIMVLCSVALVGCGGINANTDPADITSSIVTEKEWREACSFIGMRDRGYELINEIEYPVMKKLSATVKFKSIVEDAEINYNYDFVSINKENFNWACKVKVSTNYNGQKLEEEREISSPITQSNGYSHAFYELREYMDSVVGDFNEFSYDQEKGAYCKTIDEEFDSGEERELLLKFKGNRLVCYQEISFVSDREMSIIFYNYN